MKYICIITSLLITSSALLTAMDYDRERQQRQEYRQHADQSTNIHDTDGDAALATALQEILDEDDVQALSAYGALDPQEFSSAQLLLYDDEDDINQYDLPEFNGMTEDEELAAALAASLETEHQGTSATTQTTTVAGPRYGKDTPRLASNQPVRTKTDIKKQAHSTIITGTEECPICGSSLEELGREQARFTNCCGRFICQTDFDKMETRAVELSVNMQNPEWRRRYSQSEDFGGWPYKLEDIDNHRHAECPFCRNYPLEVVPSTDQTPEQNAPAPAAQPHDPVQQAAANPATAHLAQLEVRPAMAQLVETFFNFLNPCIESAGRNNVDALRALENELKITGNRERFKTCILTLQAKELESVLPENNLINTIWEHIIKSLPRIEQERQPLEDHIAHMAAGLQRQQIINAHYMQDVLTLWQASLRQGGKVVWQILNPTQKLFYLYRLKFHCQVAEILSRLQQ